MTNKLYDDSNWREEYKELYLVIKGILNSREWIK